LNDTYQFINTPLTYGYGALEPYIGQKTMEVHHDRLLQAYVEHLNDTLKDLPWLQKLTLEELIIQADTLPMSVRTDIRHFAGGVYNHRLFFSGMTPGPSAAPSGRLGEALSRTYGSYGAFKTEFKQAAMSVFGSGYAWLVAGKNGQLRIFVTANQDTPLTRTVRPVLTVDVWEHAYFLQYLNLRGDYIDAWFHVIDWAEAEKNYLACMG
jgi:Fe-Mn family superoxide dismutase